MSRPEPPRDAARRIGLYGGSFDPVHLAHLALARAAMPALALDQLRWVPTGQAWQKARPLTPAPQRVAMLKLALAGEPGWVLDERELRRAGPSYTLDTVAELRAELPAATLVLLVGADQLAGLPSWHRWRELLAQVELAVAARPGAAPPPPELAGLPRHTVPMPEMAVSATEIRQRAAAHQPLDGLVPPEVARYIARERLYTADTRS